MEEIRGIVEKVLMQLQDKRPSWQEDIRGAWTRILGSAESSHTKIDGLERSTLTVLVDSPARRYQLNLKRKKIINMLREQCPQIKNVYFKIGNVHE